MPCLLRFAYCLQKMALIIQSQAFQIRNNTDYADFFVVSFEDAREQADRAKEFLKVEDIGENK